VEKSLCVETIIHSLHQINLRNNLGLKIEKSKDGPCEDGRNIITEWKLLPPDVTIENAEKYFSDFGVIASRQETDEGLFVTFSIIFDTLPLCQLINPHVNKGSKWFAVFKNRPTLCRFVSSLSCSNCLLQGHHHSKCPGGLVEVAKQYRKFIQGTKSSTNPSNNNQNQHGTIKVSRKAKKSANHRSSNVSALDKESNLSVDSEGDRKKSRIEEESGELPQHTVVKPAEFSVRFSLPSSSVVGLGSDPGSILMDTSLDLQPDKDMIKKQGGSSDAGASKIGLAKGNPNVSIDDNNFFATFPTPKKKSK